MRMCNILKYSENVRRRGWGSHFDAPSANKSSVIRIGRALFFATIRCIPYWRKTVLIENTVHSSDVCERGAFGYLSLSYAFTIDIWWEQFSSNSFIGGGSIYPRAVFEPSCFVLLAIYFLYTLVYWQGKLCG